VSPLEPRYIADPSLYTLRGGPGASVGFRPTQPERQLESQALRLGDTPSPARRPPPAFPSME
jgi:hypothetical protein